jgi:hypothetical protein
VGPDTTCEFAESVQSAYRSSGGSGTVEAYSAVTNKSYEMTCVTTTATVKCTRGHRRVRVLLALIRRRRLLLLCAGVVALCVLGLVLFVFPTTHHVKVVRIVRTDQVGPQVSSTPSLPAASAGVQPGRKPVYEEGPGTPSAQVLGADTPAHGWSTTKVPVLVALLKARGAQGLSASEKLLAHAAITESDNQSILDLFGDLERIKGGLVGASAYIEGLSG